MNRELLALLAFLITGLALLSGAVTPRYVVDRGELAIGLVLKDPR